MYRLTALHFLCNENCFFCLFYVFFRLRRMTGMTLDWFSRPERSVVSFSIFVNLNLQDKFPCKIWPGCFFASFKIVQRFHDPYTLWEIIVGCFLRHLTVFLRYLNIFSFFRYLQAYCLLSFSLYSFIHWLFCSLYT